MLSMNARAGRRVNNGRVASERDDAAESCGRTTAEDTIIKGGLQARESLCAPLKVAAASSSSKALAVRELAIAQGPVVWVRQRIE